MVGKQGLRSLQVRVGRRDCEQGGGEMRKSPEVGLAVSLKWEAALLDSEELSSNLDPATQLSEVGEMMSLIWAVVCFTKWVYDPSLSFCCGD